MPIILNGTTGITTPGITNTGPFVFQGVVELPAGAVGAPSLTTTGDTNTGIYFPAADTIAFAEGGVEAARFDSAGNFGLGVTPGTWGSTLRALQIGRDGAVSAGTTFSEIYLSGNARYDGSNWRYISTNPAAFYSVGETYHRWFIAGSGTAGNAITFTQAMTLDASGNLGIGTNSPTLKLDVNGSAKFAGNYVSFNDNGYIRTDAANILRFQPGSSGYEFRNSSNSANLAVLDSSGNLGLGVTPSAWNSAYTAFQSRNASFFGTINVTEAAIGANALIAAGGGRYISNGQASIYQQINGTHIWYNAPSGTAGAAATFTQAMTLDASGNLSNGGNYTSTGAGNTRYIGFNFYGNLQYNLYVDGVSDAASMLIRSGTTERARFTSDGYWLVGTTLGGLSRVFHNNSGANTFQVANSSTNTSSSAMEVNVNYTGNTTGWFIRGGDLSLYRFYIYTNGNIVNSNSSYGGISDIKTKQDVVDAASQWDDIKALRVRKFRFKTDPSGPLQIGVVAQELEQVSPGLVDESVDRDKDGNDLGTTTKSVKYSVLYMKSIKALQEAMLRIEQLEADMAVMKGSN